MKKLSAIILSVVMIVSVLFTFTGCFGAPQQEENISNVFDILHYGSQEPVSFGEITATEFVTFLTEAAKAKPYTPDYFKGVKIEIMDDYDYMSGIYNVEVSNFVLKTKKTGNVLLAEGSMNYSLTAPTSYQNANITYYHDGTYLGMDIIQTGFPDDKQKEELPLVSISNYYNDGSFLNNIVQTMKAPSANDIKSAISKQMQNPAALDDLEIVKAQYDKFVIFIISDVEDSTGKVVEDFHIAYDTYYNVVGYAKETRYGWCSIATNREAVTLPADWDSWTIRPNA